MGRLHVAPTVGTGSSSRHANLIDEVALEFPNIGRRKPAIDPGVGSHICHKLFNDCGNRRLSAEPVV
jgi:hypothetical protein